LERVLVKRLATAVAAGVIVVALNGCQARQFQQLTCDQDDASLVLAAQAVPTATLLPCIEEFPVGWIFGGSEIRSGLVRFWLDSDRAGLQALEVRLTRTCDVSRAVEVTPAADEVGTRRFEEPISLPPRFELNRYYVFPGGCATYRFEFDVTASPTLAFEVDEALSFRPRSELVERVREEGGLELCGAGASPCPG
jgi:hypothetical protein